MAERLPRIAVYGGCDDRLVCRGTVELARLNLGEGGLVMSNAVVKICTLQFADRAAGATAVRLGMKRSTLQKKMKKLDIARPE